MKLEQQVCSLELAKKLKELGIKQKSYFYHYFTEFGSSAVLQGEDHLSIVDDTGKRREFVGFVSAFTVAELGEMLPGNIDGDIFQTQKGVMGRLWYCTMMPPDLISAGLLKTHQEESDTEADARAKMLVYLIENKLISL